MRQVRMIRIFFLICAAISVAAFWTGWFFGNARSTASLSATEDTTDLYLDNGEDASETMSDLNRAGETGNDASGTGTDNTDSADAGHSGTESDSSGDSGGKNTESEEEMSGSGLSEDDSAMYCLKQEGDTLVVYQGSSEEILFDTGMKVSDLPEDVREDTESGIFFDSLEELYGFLENYSS